MRILADENIPRGMIDALRTAGHDVLSIAEMAPSSSDGVVLGEAVTTARVLLTFDADFGRMIFAEGFAAPPGVIYLRSPPPSPAIGIERVMRIVGADSPAIDGHFVSVDRTVRFHPFPEKKNNG